MSSDHELAQELKLQTECEHCGHSLGPREMLHDRGLMSASTHCPVSPTSALASSDTPGPGVMGETLGARPHVRRSVGAGPPWSCGNVVQRAEECQTAPRTAPPGRRRLEEESVVAVGRAPLCKSPTSFHSSEVAKIAPAVLEADLPVRLAAKTFVSGIVFSAILKDVGRRIHQRSQLSPDTVSSGTCTSQASSESPPPLVEVPPSVVKSRKQDAQLKTVVPMRRVSAATLKYTARRASQILSFANSEVAGSGADTTDMAQSTTPSATEEAKSRRRDSRTLNARKPGTVAVGSAKQAVASKHGRARLGADNLQDIQLMKSNSDELDSWSNASGSPTSAISQEAAPVSWWSTTAPSQGDVPLYHRQLEVALSGAHLGTLLASPQSSAVFSGQPISLLVDESAATLLAALAGQVASPTGPTLAEVEAAAAQDAAERAAAAAAAAAEALAATAAGTTVAPAKKRLEDPDVFVVSAKAGAPGTVCADDLPGDDRRSVPSSADRSQSGSAAVGCSGASDLQLRSTVLMHELHDPSLRIHHLSNLDALHAPRQSLSR
eukprot:CAMPEP_0194548262 /NCGR_PEP_ID=MMETSP0253-20130528/93366_1 /TAXON_ID=2966 /ORGANISM="Noctiluca scintillans" /LENGTH=549 /DNA_ID=CAMNT_0039395555 /DNA_START=32 /DNA_END=1677 /DNA_ORIENTATION=+